MTDIATFTVFRK